MVFVRREAKTAPPAWIRQRTPMSISRNIRLTCLSLVIIALYRATYQRKDSFQFVKVHRISACEPVVNIVQIAQGNRLEIVLFS